MKKVLLATVFAALSMTSAFAQDGDLTIPGQRWIAKFNKYVCAAFGPEVAAPRGFSGLNVKFEQITTDYTLDNGLLKASFEQDGVTCRYSAILLADNAAATLRLVQSKAYAPAGGSECAEGKAIIDAAMEANDYLYYGHPHNLAVMAPIAGAEEVCGAGNNLMGVNFVVSGRLPEQQ